MPTSNSAAQRADVLEVLERLDLLLRAADDPEYDQDALLALLDEPVEEAIEALQKFRRSLPN